MPAWLLGICFVNLTSMWGVLNIPPVVPVIAEAMGLNVDQMVQLVVAFT